MASTAAPDATTSFRKRESRPFPVFSLSLSMNIFISMRLWLLLPLLAHCLPLPSQLSQVDFLARARSFLLSVNASEAVPTARRLVVSEQVSLQTPLGRLMTRLEIQLERNLTAIEVMLLKPMVGFKDRKCHLASNLTHIGVLLGYSDGVVELREAAGGLLYRHNTDTNEAITLLATTGTADGSSYTDLHFALATSARFQSIRLDMFALKRDTTVKVGEWGSQTSRAALGLVVEGEEVMEQQIRTVAYYGKGSTKYWLLGDAAGGINIHYVNGTFVRRTDLGKGPVTSLERSGALLYFAAGSTIGVWQPHQSPSSLCEEVLATQHSVPITHLLSDQTLLFVAYENGDILAFDTKHAVGKEHICKVIWRIAGKERPVKLAGSKGALLVWTERHTLMVHTNLFQDLQSSAVALPESQGPFKAARYQSGHLLLVSSGETSLRLMEVLPVYRSVNTAWDTSSYKVIL